MKLSILIITIPHDKQRYDTVGDWQFNRKTGVLEIRVSDAGDWKKEMAVALHEFIEATLCMARNISQKDVDAFDIEYERNRKINDDSEPGDSIKAPYYKEHQFATAVERLYVNELGLDWIKYEENIIAISDTYRQP